MLSKNEETAWRTLRANGYKSSIGICGALHGILFVVVLIIVWIFGVPFLPPSFLDYGWLLHIGHSVLWALALAVSGSKSVELISMAIALTLVVLMFDTWALVFSLVPWLYGCIVDSPSSFYYNCVSNAPYMITLFVMGLVCMLCTVFIFYNMFALLAYIKRSVADLRPYPSDYAADTKRA